MANNKPDVILRLRQNLTTLLRDREMTASELSRKTGVAKQVLSDWMAGVQPRRLDHLYHVALALGVSIERLCFTVDDKDVLAKKTESSDIPPGGSSDIQELRGRYELYLRRIGDN